MRVKDNFAVQPLNGSVLRLPIVRSNGKLYSDSQTIVRNLADDGFHKTGLAPGLKFLKPCVPPQMMILVTGDLQ